MRAERLHGIAPTIFSEMSALALRTGSVNLGQGFPDRDGPPSVIARAVAALEGGANQYAPGLGVPALREAVARHQQCHYGLDLDPDSQVVVTTGCTEAIAAALLGLVDPGDEVVVLEPYYDSYVAMLQMAGGIRRPVTLRPPDFRLDADELRAAVTPRTRFMLVNTPHNPTGTVLSRDELAVVAEVATTHDLVVITDEVYEHLTFDGLTHVPPSTLPGMRARTVRVGSAGKIFSLTGWKIGWIMGPAALIGTISKIHQFVTFTTSPALQIGVAHGLDHEQDWYLALPRIFQARRDALVKGLTAAGFRTMPCEGTYFVTADFGPLGVNEDDVAFAKRLTVRHGVTSIPLSVFYGADAPTRFVRFAFCKKQETIDAALSRLASKA